MAGNVHRVACTTAQHSLRSVCSPHRAWTAPPASLAAAAAAAGLGGWAAEQHAALEEVWPAEFDEDFFLPPSPSHAALDIAPLGLGLALPSL